MWGIGGDNVGLMHQSTKAPATRGCPWALSKTREVVTTCVCEREKEMENKGERERGREKEMDRYT